MVIFGLYNILLRVGFIIMPHERCRESMPIRSLVFFLEVWTRTHTIIRQDNYYKKPVKVMTTRVSSFPAWIYPWLEWSFYDNDDKESIRSGSDFSVNTSGQSIVAGYYQPQWTFVKEPWKVLSVYQFTDLCFMSL